MVHVVLGAQWGDEGKGKIVDLLSQKADCAVRFHGGNNAGHTIINEYGKFPLHLVPSGIFNTKCQVFIGNGTILDLEVLIDEIEMLQSKLPDFSKRLFISPRCHVIMPYHKILDALYEQAKGKSKTGTTGRGIGPTYADKVSYNGIRLFDMMDKKHFEKRLEIMLTLKNKIIKALGGDELEIKQVMKKQLQLFEKIKPYVRDVFNPLMKAIDQNKKIIFEGAQGIFLDNDWGTYPFVTGSSVVAGNINAGAGVAARHIKRITGVSKAYTTRVGAGPFPTELNDKTGEKIRAVGGEYGATTGRPRRCGWMDVEMLKFSCQLNGLTDVAITKLDVLDDFKELKICVGYELNGKRVSYVDCDANMLERIEPVYKTFKGWMSPTTKVKKYGSLPPLARKYLEAIASYAKVKISIVSVGPERNQTIIK